MAAESGTAPKIDDAVNDKNKRDVPEGWLSTEDGAWAMPDHRHLVFRDQRINQLDRRTDTLLAGTPEIQTAVEHLAHTYGPGLNQLDQELQSDIAANLWDPPGPARLRLRDLIDQINHVASDIAKQLTPIGVSIPTCACYLIDQAFSDDTITGRKIKEEVRLRQSIEQSVQLRTRLKDEVGFIPVHRGELVMKFSAASQSERNAYTDLIRSAQRFHGHPGNDGGRPTGAKGKERALLICLAAKLAHWAAFPEEAIAEIFGWLPIPPDVTDQGERCRLERDAINKAREYVTDGEAALNQEHGATWKKEIPPHTARLAVKHLEQRGITLPSRQKTGRL